MSDFFEIVGAWVVGAILGFLFGLGVIRFIELVVQ